MSDTTRQTRPTTKRQANRPGQSKLKPPVLVGEMTYLFLITVAAALLTGVLALPLTMPSGSFAALPADARDAVRLAA
ncbi:hypothetical protein DKT77_01245 [Meridianimarinicoccus roseus]|uniref:Uncharacterized protein n=1 Tax=Meridianimarinicoccus roseus TaxID=2072018 RepID=A0A2V2LQY5_9RHOB|nr:hypothetical protein DKT77_01245 [Meridianimarinicoccus roseus]